MEDNVNSIEKKKLDKLKRGNYFKLLDEYECLKLRVYERDHLNPNELRRIVLLSKFFMKYGKTNFTKMSAKSFLRKYERPIAVAYSNLTGNNNNAT